MAPTEEDHAGASYEEDDLYENDYHHMLTSPVPSVDIDKHIGYLSYLQNRIKCNSGTLLSRPPTPEHFRPGSS